MTTAPLRARPMPFTVLIPSRLQSTRLPEKALADIGGVPMVVRVAQRALQSLASRVVVATDSRKIIEEAERHGIAALMTRSDHPSGSDRLAEAASLLGLDEEEIVVNVQGDEPLIDPALIDALAEKMTQAPSVPMATVAHPIHSLEDWCNPNVVKVVMDARDHALYFSRAPIPWKRGNRVAAPTDLPDPLPMRHVGIYGYRTRFLQEFPKLAPAPEEATEALEQLRVLWHGHPIIVHRATEAPPAGVDTQDDLDRVRALFA